MGWAKEQLIRQMEQGWRGVGQKWVCAKCFDDEAIQEFIAESAVKKRCCYCRRFARSAIAAHMDDVLGFVAAGINFEYEDAANGVHWESAEGGYTLPTMDSWDLLEHIGLDVENDDLREDLRAAFRETPWVPKDPYADRWCDTLKYSWEDFSKLVKHQTRFVFFRVKTANRDHNEREPYEFLDSLRSAVTEANLLQTIPVGQKWFRAQEHGVGETLSGACRLGTPPPELASHSRMSPAGISMLYVAKDAETAVAEVKSNAPGSVCTVAEFKNLRPLHVLDLSTIEAVPSLFDAQRRHMRMALKFLRHFADEIAKPVSESEKPYEYVPTQVMTEYFRHLFHEPREIRIPHCPLPFGNGSSPASATPTTYIEENPRIDGIAFRSSKRPGGVNYTLFIEPEMCGDAPASEIVMLLAGATRHP